MFFLSVLISTIYLMLSAIIDIYWLNEISSVFGNIFAYFIIIFVALIPGFIFIFVTSSLILNKNKNRKKRRLNYYPSVTVLVPAYNASGTIIDTIKSILKQRYNGKIIIKVIDDGSSDDTVEILRNSNISKCIDILVEEHIGKFNALNVGLYNVDTKYVITVDSDTTLHELAIANIICEIEHSRYAAVAGCLFVRNDKQTFITKLQQWDYTIGIFGIKLMQSFYKSTLVTQGAFSIYRTDVLKSLGGWTDNVGEDIILTWNMLKDGYKTGFAGDAVAYTDVPETFKKLGIQRKRWARGMIEAFKEVKHFFSSAASIQSKFLVFLNLFFPFTDIAALIFLPLGIILLIAGNNLLIGLLTILLIPLGLTLSIIIEIKRRNALKKVEYKLEKRSKLAFVAYALLYNFLLAPFCLMGYISEIFKMKKNWYRG